MVILTRFSENGCLFFKVWVKEPCSITWWRITKNCRPPNFLDSIYIFELWWQLRKFWQLKKVVRTRNGSLLIFFFWQNKVNFALCQQGLRFFNLTFILADLDITCTRVCTLYAALSSFWFTWNAIKYTLHDCSSISLFVSIWKTIFTSFLTFKTA